jgi:GNAT superfamily N-acetyltransferase
LLRALCGTGGADVLLVTDCRGTVIGHGMAADATAGDLPTGHAPESSIGLVVADAWQRRGIGTQLLDALAGRARVRGVSRLVLEVLPDNRVMLGIIRRRWPEAPAERTRDAIVFRPAIGQAGGPMPIPRVVAIGEHGYQGGQGAKDRSAA